MVVYKGVGLMKGSVALMLWQEWQKETKDRAVAQKKLDNHMKDVDKRYKELLEKYRDLIDTADSLNEQKN